jgi:hypothetical protein
VARDEVEAVDATRYYKLAGGSSLESRRRQGSFKAVTNYGSPLFFLEGFRGTKESGTQEGSESLREPQRVPESLSYSRSLTDRTHSNTLSSTNIATITNSPNLPHPTPARPHWGPHAPLPAGPRCRASHSPTHGTPGQPRPDALSLSIPPLARLSHPHLLLRTHAATLARAQFHTAIHTSTPEPTPTPTPTPEPTPIPWRPEV